MKNDIHQRDSLLHHGFENQVTKQPNALAICSPTKKLTYQELSNLSNRTAKWLIEAGAAQNKLIAIVMEKGWEQVVATLAILKAGAAYLPIDPNESIERIKHLLEITETRLVLTQEKIEQKLSYFNHIKTFSVDNLELNAEETFPDFNYRQTEDDLAYVIFTSGSTGNPKGVMISHKAVINTINDINQRFNLTSRDRIFALSALNFDLSVYDIFGSLSAGAAIIFPSSKDEKNPSIWLELILRENITVWNSVPALLQLIIYYLESCHDPFVLEKLKNSLRLIMLSGDWIPTNLPEKVFSLFGDIELISLGGATEASIWSILYPIKKDQTFEKSIPYGKAMLNQSFLVLDEQLNEAAVGVSGELYIGGIGIAKGYWGDPERTKSHFIVHPLLTR